MLIKLVEIIHRNDIQALYHADDKLVYTFLDSAYGEIFGVYDFVNGKITCCITWSCHVPERCRWQVLQYIKLANSKQKNGRLYLDRQTQCLVYGADFDTNKGLSGFEVFCMSGYNVFTSNLQSLYRIIQCSPMKGDSPYPARDDN